MAGREVAISLGVGLPLAFVCAVHPIHVGGAILGRDCGPAWAASIVRPADDSSSTADLVSRCHTLGFVWLLLAGFLALVAAGLALVLGIAVKRTPKYVVIPQTPPPITVPSGWALTEAGWWSPAGWVAPPGWVCPPPGYAGTLPANRAE